MKGKSHFNISEAKTIRHILLERPRTKVTRDGLRAIGFYISDFGLPSPLTVADFDRLIATGAITVIGEGAATPISHAELRSVANIVDGDAESARQRYRPDHIRHLMIGESAPNGGTFFYHANSILFRQTRRAFNEVSGNTCGEGEAFLRFFRDRGFFLDDLCSVPVNGMDDPDRLRERAAGVEPLAARINSAMPKTVIIVMKAIGPEVRQACRLAGASPVIVELPFPRPEHQAQFVSGLADFLRSIL